MIDTSVRPCDDFWNYTGGKFDKTYFNGWRTGFYMSLLSDFGISNQFESIRKIRQIYGNCNPQAFPLIVVEYTYEQTAEFLAREFHDVKFPVHMDQLRDDQKYASILARVYKCLFERGSNVFRRVFDYHSISRIYFKEPENTGSSASKWAAYCAIAECQKPIGYPEKYKYSPKLLNVSTQAFVSTAFGTDVNLSDFRVAWPVYSSDNINKVYQSRSYLLNNLFLEIFDNKKRYDTCEDYIILNFPLHTTKLMVDNIKRNRTVFQQLKEEYFTMVNLLLDEAKKFVRESKVMEKEAIEVLGALLDQNTFLFVDHPIFDDDNFERYTRDISLKRPQASIFVNNYRPILNYEREHGGKHIRLMTQVLNAQHTKSNQLNSFDFGIFLYPLYDVNWPPTLTLSGMGFVIAHEIGHTFLKTYNISTSLYENYECIKKLYEGQCRPQEPRVCLDPGMTYEENIADQLGIRWAYAAFKTYSLHKQLLPHTTSRVLNAMSDDQLFFLNLGQLMRFMHPTWDTYDKGDTHSPDMVRLYGTLSNFPAFANAYGCLANDTFVSKKPCPILLKETEGDKSIWSGYTRLP